MPLPPELSKKASPKKKKKRMADTMHELAHGPVTAPSRKATHGAQRQKQNVAIAMKNAGMAKPKRKKGKK